jgi:transmembrane sensor
MSSSQRIGWLMFRYVRKEISRGEKKELRAWRRLSDKNESFFQSATDPKNLRKRIASMPETREQILKKIQERYPDIHDLTTEVEQAPTIFYMSPRKRFIAVAAAIIIGLGWYLFVPDSSIKSGSDNASVITPDGTKDDLNSHWRDFKRGYNEEYAGVIHRFKNGRLILLAPNEPKSRKDRYYTLFTKRGGEYALELSDGTIIWVNAATTIRYPANMLQDTIHISIDGEAFFEIPDSAKHVYIVDGLTVDGLRITVGSAHFNFMNYSDEPAMLMTLIKGTAGIRTDTTAAGSERNLIAGQQAKLDSGKLSIADMADTRDIIAWTENKTSFHDADIRTIMRFVARWYDADVVFEGNIPDKKFTVSLPRGAKISELLGVLEKQGARFTVHRKTITVTP